VLAPVGLEVEDPECGIGSGEAAEEGEAPIGAPIVHGDDLAGQVPVLPQPIQSEPQAAVELDEDGLLVVDGDDDGQFGRRVHRRVCARDHGEIIVPAGIPGVGPTEDREGLGNAEMTAPMS